MLNFLQCTTDEPAQTNRGLLGHLALHLQTNLIVFWESKERYKYSIRNQLNKIHNEVAIFIENKLHKLERAESFKTGLESI